MIIKRERESSIYNSNAAPSLNLSFSDLHFFKVNCSPLTEVTEFGGRRGSANGPPSSQVSFSTGVAKHDVQIENQKADTSDEKIVNIINVEGKCELLSEAVIEVPIVTETNSMASGSWNSLGMKYEERSLDIAEPSPVQNHGMAGGKQLQQGRKQNQYIRKGRQGKR